MANNRPVIAKVTAEDFLHARRVAQCHERVRAHARGLESDFGSVAIRFITKASLWPVV
jgi:hypothetical protein